VSGRFSPLDAPLPLTRPSAPAPLRSRYASGYAPAPLRSRSAPAPLPLRSRSTVFFQVPLPLRSAPAPLPLIRFSGPLRSIFRSRSRYAHMLTTQCHSARSTTRIGHNKKPTTTTSVCHSCAVQLLTYLLTYLIIKKYFSTARDFVYKY